MPYFKSKEHVKVLNIGIGHSDYWEHTDAGKKWKSLLLKYGAKIAYYGVGEIRYSRNLGYTGQLTWPDANGNFSASSEVGWHNKAKLALWGGEDGK